jgi:hypothetical protein
MRRKVLLRREDSVAVAASVGTTMLVVITVAMITVVGVFVFDVVRLPEDPPDVDVVYTHLNDRWSIHVNSVSEEQDISDFRLLARNSDGTFVTYDPDGDATADALLSVNLDDIISASGSGPQPAPVSFIDVDKDGKISSGDQLFVRAVYMPGHSLFMDGDRAFKKVGTGPHAIPKDSTLILNANSITLVTSDIQPGDQVDIVIKHGSTVEATLSGHASASGFYSEEVYIDPAWHNGNHKVFFTVRAGEIDEWNDMVMFRAKNPEPITPAEEEQYAELMKPLENGDTIALVHKPTNSVVLEFDL